MIDIIVIALYLAILGVIGVMNLKKIRGIDGFFVGGRTAGTSLVAGSMLATIIGGSSTLGLAGLGYSRGWTAAWWLLAGTAGLVLLAVSFGRKIRSYGVYTLPEMLERQYGGRWIKITASIVISLSWLGVIAGQIVAVGKVLATLWPGQIEALIVLVGIVFTAYTAMGGQYSILKTDAFQFVLIVVGIAVCAVLGHRAVGGWDALSLALPPGHLSFPVSAAFGWGDVGMYLLFVGSVYLIGPDIYSRLFCARSPESARRVLLISAGVLVPVAFAVVFLGMSARVLAPGIPPESALPSLLLRVAPAGLGGLVVAAFLAALMSSADTCLMTVSTMISADVVNPLRGGVMDERSVLRLSRVVIVGTGVLSVAIALCMKGIVSSLLLAYTVYSAAFLVPVIMGFFSKRLRLTAGGAVASVLGSGALALALKLSGRDGMMVAVFAVSAALLAGGSCLSRRVRRPEAADRS